jgi:hypothetical protein
LYGREEALAPEIFPNLKTALLPLMAEGVYPYMDLLRAQVSYNESTNTKQTKREVSKSAASEQEEDEQFAGRGEPDKDSVKWGSECLSVVPDSWLEEELRRRKEAKKEYSGEEGGTTSVPLVGGQGVKLCNTGKCEMFD